MTAERVASVGDIPAGEARSFHLAGQPICIVNLGVDGFRAVGDVCSHAEAYLHEGELDVEDATIECPLHGSVFDLNTGAARTLPATKPVPVYDVAVDGDDLMIEVNA